MRDAIKYTDWRARGSDDCAMDGGRRHKWELLPNIAIDGQSAVMACTICGILRLAFNSDMEKEAADAK
jgi:hypothetical protein